jgi:ribosome production factor 2
MCAVRRTQLASEDLFKSACAQVKNVRGVKKVKNISEDAFGTKLGRIHVPAQEISKIQVLYTQLLIGSTYKTPEMEITKSKNP